MEPRDRRLPNGKPISALGFGCSSIFAQSRFSDAAAQLLLETAAQEGINHFDTGPSYGRGLGEARLGRFLSGRDVSKFVLSTKVGTNYVQGRLLRSFDPVIMRRCFEDSLCRLKLDRVDVLYLHGPAMEDINTETLNFFDSLKKEGKTVYSGVNSFSSEVIAKTADSPIDVVMLQYSAADLRLVSLLNSLTDRRKVVISGTALGRGVFRPADFFKANRDSMWYLLRLAKHDPTFWAKSSRLRRQLENIDEDPYRAAVRFIVSEPLILSSLFGSTKVENVRSNARASQDPLSDFDFQFLARLREKA